MPLVDREAVLQEFVARRREAAANRARAERCLDEPSAPTTTPAAAPAPAAKPAANPLPAASAAALTPAPAAPAVAVAPAPAAAAAAAASLPGLAAIAESRPAAPKAPSVYEVSMTSITSGFVC